MKVLVCGSRSWTDKEYIFNNLTQLEKMFNKPISKIISGGAGGADTIAVEFAIYRKIAYSVYNADWADQKLMAGRIRNKKMLEHGKPDVVVGFAEYIEFSPGTRNMLNIARKAEIPTLLFTGEK